jgi:hypothetical protein
VTDDDRTRSSPVAVMLGIFAANARNMLKEDRTTPRLMRVEAEFDETLAETNGQERAEKRSRREQEEDVFKETHTKKGDFGRDTVP